jgi:hypothetical protein
MCASDIVATVRNTSPSCIRFLTPVSSRVRNLTVIKLRATDGRNHGAQATSMGTYQLRGPLAPQTYSVLPRSSHDMRVQRCYIILHPTPRACYCGLGRQVGARFLLFFTTSCWHRLHSAVAARVMMAHCTAPTTNCSADWQCNHPVSLHLAPTRSPFAICAEFYYKSSSRGMLGSNEPSVL